ncbi:MAG: hypothetical protein NC399_10985 [Muribaculum sp.]|nr:hypothetical protein [Muribaculum sp.]
MEIRNRQSEEIGDINLDIKIDIGINIEINMEIQNGKAEIELTLPSLPNAEGGNWTICLWDEQEHLAFYGVHPVREEDPCIIRLLHPHLWQGKENPYRYRLEVYGERHGLLDPSLWICRALPIRKWTEVPGKGSFLNGQPFCARKVYYDRADLGIDPGMNSVSYAERVRRRLAQLVKMGANLIVLRERDGQAYHETGDKSANPKAADPGLAGLQDLCDEAGLLLECAESVDDGESGAGGIQAGVRGERLFLPNGLPTACYYKQKARWSSEPFVYIDLNSLRKQSDGSYAVAVYSNQKKAALFVNGRVFGFQYEGPEFVFQDIPVRHFPLCLAAEAGESRMSVTCC